MNLFLFPISFFPECKRFLFQALTLVKTCEPVAEMRECRAPRDWSLLALQNTRTGKSHYLVICRCPDSNILGRKDIRYNLDIFSNLKISRSIFLCLRGSDESRSADVRQRARNSGLRHDVRARQQTRTAIAAHT